MFSAGNSDAHLSAQAEAGRLRIQGQPGLYTDALTWKKKKKVCMFI